VGVEEHTIELGGMPVFYRRAAPSSAGAPPIVYLHGVPTSSDDWLPFLERTGGIAPDLIGFGRTGKAGYLDYSINGLSGFLESFMDYLELGRVQLVMHDWGAAPGLVYAQRHPERVHRLVLVNALPLLPGFRWQGPARLWRRPGLGELAMGSIPKWLFARTLREGSVNPEAWPDARVKELWQQFDQGTQRATLRLHRSGDEARLAEAGTHLDTISAPTLVIWGECDPWLPPKLGEDYAERLPDARLERIADAGHWPWLDQPTVIDRVAEFLD
jgi:pimeloyl-ACP methyl ester carboxylesterase